MSPRRIKSSVSAHLRSFFFYSISTNYVIIPKSSQTSVTVFYRKNKKMFSTLQNNLDIFHGDKAIQRSLSWKTQYFGANVFLRSTKISSEIQLGFFSHDVGQHITVVTL